MRISVVQSALGDNLAEMETRFHADINGDIMLHEFVTAARVKCFVAYIDGMASGATINDFVLRPLLRCDARKIAPESVIETCQMKPSIHLDDAVAAVLAGDSAVFIDGLSECFLCETKGFDRRSISMPTTENTIKGSQEAFGETLRQNTTMVHRIIKSSELVTEMVTVGELNHDTCAVMYLNDIVSKEILAELKRRLSSIKGDYIAGSGMVMQMIEDNPWSLFPSILSTERPERAANYLNSGRIIVIVDGSPHAIVLPVTLALLLDSPEGSSLRWQNGTYTRILRLFALFFTTMLSGLYLALILFHREMIPITLLDSIVAARENIPFPSIFEVLVMELFFELVREAGLRIPNMLGNAIGIVGALILGQSAVEANLVSPVTLIVVALSGLGNSALPDYDLAFGIRTIKLLFILMGGFFGFLGIAVALALVFAVLANQNSFGVPMLSMQSVRHSAGTSLFFQKPLWKQETRPKELHPQKEEQAPPVSRPWAAEEGKNG